MIRELGNILCSGPGQSIFSVLLLFVFPSGQAYDSISSQYFWSSASHVLLRDIINTTCQKKKRKKRKKGEASFQMIIRKCQHCHRPSESTGMTCSKQVLAGSPQSYIARHYRRIQRSISSRWTASFNHASSQPSMHFISVVSLARRKPRPQTPLSQRPPPPMP